MDFKQTKKILALCDKLKNEQKADYIKIYYTNDEEYCIKAIKDEYVIAKDRKRTKIADLRLEKKEN